MSEEADKIDKEGGDEDEEDSSRPRTLMQRLGLSQASHWSPEGATSHKESGWPSAVRKNVADLTRSCMGRRPRRRGGRRDEVECLSYQETPEADRPGGRRPASVKRKSRDLKQVEDDVENDSLERSSPVPEGIRRAVANDEPIPVVDVVLQDFEDFERNALAAVASSRDVRQRPSMVFEAAVLNFFSNVTSHRPLSTLVNNTFQSSGPLATAAVHSQIDCENFLIPHQREIINCPFYWGKIDRYEAEELLADKPEGSFLLRDSAQDDFVFSVSFRRYSRSLHARIEEEDHLFSFDSHDPGVHCSPTVRQLLEHYKDPLSCMFFEPMLLFPVIRKTCFSLQSLTRAAIVDSMTGVRRCSINGTSANPFHDSRAYSGISELPLPKVLKQYLREYHYKHKIRTRFIEVN